jgi:hypothetical protein
MLLCCFMSVDSSVHLVANHPNQMGVSFCRKKEQMIIISKLQASPCMCKSMDDPRMIA